MLSIREEIVKLGVHEDNLSNWQSDLYAPRTPKILNYLRENGIGYSVFTCEVTGNLMLEIPFGYMTEFIQEYNK